MEVLGLTWLESLTQVGSSLQIWATNNGPF